MIHRLALKTALKSNHPQYLHASLIFRAGSLIATGYNHDFRHAEIMALKNFNTAEKRKRLKKAWLFNFRISKKGTIGMAKPCTDCERALRDYGIRTVYYTSKSGILSYGLD